MILAAGERSSRPRGVSVSPNDPMTIRQAFPGLRSATAGKLLELTDALLGFSEPANEFTAALYTQKIRKLISDISTLDPKYHYDYFVPTTLEGQKNLIDGLRFARATLLLRVKGEIEPLQLEILRFAQASTDRAYEAGLALLEKGELEVPVSEPMALGNYIDRQVRRDMREKLNQFGIDWAGKGPVRVNKNEYNTADAERTFRRPDVRVGNVALDVTLENKTLRSQQIRGFFEADFRPDNVVVVRPSQLGPNSTYLITRPGGKK